MKTKFSTIILAVLAIIGVVSLTSNPLSGAAQSGIIGGGDVYLSKNKKTLQVSFITTSNPTYEDVFQIPIDGNGSTWELTDWWSSYQNLEWRIARNGGLKFDRFDTNTNTYVHHRGMIMEEGDILQVFANTGNGHRAFATGLFQN